MQEVVATLTNMHRDGKSDAIVRQPSLCEHLATGRTDAWVSDLDSDADEDREGGLQLEEPVTDESEFGNTELEDHLLHLEVVLSKLREVNLKLNPGKCCFATESIVFLGYVVSKEGAKPDPKKIDAMLRFPKPTTITSVMSFLGLTGYYWKYVRGYSRLASPLFELTKKDIAFVWNRDC